MSTEGPKYLFAPPPTDDLRELSLADPDPRRRSDSASSGMSNSSSCSVSSSGLPNSAQKSACIVPPQKNKSFSIIEPSLLQPFVQHPNYPSQIPQIQCNTHNSSTYNRSPSQGDVAQSQYIQNIGYQREITVYTPGIPSSREYQVVSSPASYKVEVGIPSTHQQEYPNQQYLPQHTVPVSQSNFRAESPLMFPNHHRSIGYVQPSSKYGTQHGENHSSQASIVLNKSPTGRVSPERTVPLVPNTGHGQPHLMVPSYSDSQLLQNISISPTNVGPVHSAQSVTQTHGDPSYNAPLFVTLSNVGVSKKNEQGLSGHSTLPHLNNKYGMLNLVPSQIPPHNYVGRVFPEMTSAGTLPSSASQASSQVPQLYTHYPAMQDRCFVPGHPQGPVRTGSLENETTLVINPNIERVVQTPMQVMSPASSHSSLSSESSQLDNHRRRSGSLQEEQAYIQGQFLYKVQI